MEKRLIALMLSGAVGVSLMSGCAQQPEEENKEERLYANYGREYGVVDDAYIVLDQNETDVMHKGTMSVVFCDGYNAGAPSTNFKFDFNCGQKTSSNRRYQTFNTEPEEEFYDKKCEDCFGIDN